MIQHDKQNINAVKKSFRSIFTLSFYFYRFLVDQRQVYMIILQTAEL